MPRRVVPVAELVAGAKSGDPRSIGRLISLVEDSSPSLREVMGGLAAHSPHAHVVGITGAPGVGKSTSTNALVRHLRDLGHRVGVLAIDPSSPFSGGALLGDRVRMGDHALDRGVFIRSMASRGQLGGLAWSTPQALRVLDAAGFDTVLIETVGVGQSEVDVAALADTTVVLLAPGMGDGVQATKAGILEIGDIYVINKADRDGAHQLRRELRTGLSMTHRDPEDWQPPIELTRATSDEGVGAVVDAITRHADWLRESGELTARRERRAREEIETIAMSSLQREWRERRGAELALLGAEVVGGKLDAYTAADRMLELDPRSGDPK